MTSGLPRNGGEDLRVARPDRVLLIGLDAAVPGRWRRFAESGLLPIGRRLLADGCFARCLPVMPTLTTTNWATIATGALPATHGVTDFNPHRRGDVPDQSLQGFDAQSTAAEFLWEAAARGGCDSVVVNWPGSWPPRAWPASDEQRGAAGPAHQGRVTIVGGAGIELDEWRIGLPARDRLVALAAEQRFSTRPEPGALLVTLPPAGELFELPFEYRASFSPVTGPPASLVCCLATRADRPVVRLSLRGASEALAELAEGEWSERFVLPFEVDGETVAGAFRVKLLELDPAAGAFRLYVSDICRLSWLEQPAGVLGDVSRFGGLPTPGVGWESMSAGLIDVETFVELTGMATAWLADVCADLVARCPCELLCAHFHAIDSFYHLCAAGLSEALTPDAVTRRRIAAAEKAVYRQLDTAVGRVLEAAGESVLTVLVSDHGATPPGPAVPVRRILRDAGLLATVRPGSGAGLNPGTRLGSGAGPESDAGRGGGTGTIDWSRTLAVPQGTCYVRLNLAGREPHGVVDPREAGAVRRQVMRALLEYRDPATGICPFSLAVPREEAARVGLGGEGVGDVVYAVQPEFSEVHGPILPDAMLPAGDWGMPSLCLFSGVGAAHGTLPDAGVSLIDIAPTICHVLGVPAPGECDGVVRSALLAPHLATAPGASERAVQESVD